MTPAINLLRKKKIPFTLHEYTHNPAHESYGLEAAEKLNLDPHRVFKTLVVQLNGSELVTAIVPVTTQLNLKRLAKILRGKKATMADKKLVERSTGYVLGGVSPLGQKKRTPTILCESGLSYATLFVSGGKRGLEIELSPDDLIQLTRAITGDISQPE